MTGIEQRPMTTGNARCGLTGAKEFGNAPPVLHQIRHALERLLLTGESTRIDLNAMPFGPGDLDRLTSLLGRGEVSARIDAAGPTEIQETAIPGVWLVDYRNADGERLTLQIEIADIPELLLAPHQDLATAIALLDTRLESDLSPSASPLPS
jgi:hydrogenase-1 operon protein HyaF